jgi:hypothetical protein
MFDSSVSQHSSTTETVNNFAEELDKAIPK